MSMKTWDSSHVCSSAISQPEPETVVASSDSPFQSFTAAINQKFVKKELRIEGSDPVDLLITVDDSDSFYRADTSLTAVLAVPVENAGGEDAAAVEETKLLVFPMSTDYSHKHSTTYYFADVPQGVYVLKLRQRFKAKGCNSMVSFTVKAWKSSAGQITLQPGGPRALNLYQSQAEE